MPVGRDRGGHHVIYPFYTLPSFARIKRLRDCPSYLTIDLKRGGGGGGDFAFERVGMLVGNFELNPLRSFH